MVAARGARRARRGRRLAAVRARPRRVRVAAAHGRGPRGARRRPHARAGAALLGVRGAGARLARADALRGAAAAPPPIDGAVAFLEGAGTRGTLELVADEVLALLRDGVPAEQVALVVPSLERWRAPLETVFATLGHPVRGRGRVRAAGDAARSRAPLSAPLRVGRRRAERALRVPALAVLGHRALERRLRRGAAARPRGRGAEARREETERLREAPLVALARAAGGGIAGRGRARRCSSAMASAGVRPRRPARRRDLAPRPALRRRGRRGCSTSSRAGSGLGEPLGSPPT